MGTPPFYQSQANTVSFLRRIGSVLAIGTGSTLRECVRRSRDDRAVLVSDREALARDFERVGSDLRRVLERFGKDRGDGQG